MIKKIIFLSACILSAGCFAFDSTNDKDKFTYHLNNGNGYYDVEKCFDGDTSNFCHSDDSSNNHLEIDFSTLVDINVLRIYNRVDCCLDRLSHVIFNNTYRLDLTYDAIQTISNIKGVFKIDIYSVDGKPLNLAEVFFDFQIAKDFSAGIVGGNISNGVNWSMFAYSFTIIGVLTMFGRGSKAILDVIKYG